MAIISAKDLGLEALRAKVNKAYGGGVSSAASARQMGSFRISTGSVALDLALGVETGGRGGIPVGQIAMFLGEKSSGKTTAALKCIASAQRSCARCYRPANGLQLSAATDSEGNAILRDDGKPRMILSGSCDCYAKGLWKPRSPTSFENKKAEAEWQAVLAGYTANSYLTVVVAYFDIENALDLGWAAQNGVFLDVMEHTRTGNAEEAIDIADEFIKSGVVDLLIIDSIAAMVPQTEIDASVEDWQQGLQARLVNKMVRKLVGNAATVSAQLGKYVTQIWINQYRDKIGAMAGAGKTTPGGKGQRFATSVEVEFWTSDKVEEVMPGFSELAKDDQVKHVTSKRVNFTVVKNKTAADGVKGSFKLAVKNDGEVKAGDVMEYEYVFKLAMQLGLIQKTGIKYTFRGKDFTSQSAVNALMIGNPSVWEWTKAQILDSLAGNKPKKDA